MWIDRRENSKSLALSSVLLALRNIKKVGAVVDRPKALGDIRGVSYIYGMFYRFWADRCAGYSQAEDEITQDIFLRRKETKEINFQPHCVDSTKPENLISYTNIEVDGNVLENIGDYKADGDIPLI